MVRDVLVASLNRGQFPVALVAGLFAMMLYKMPGQDVTSLLFRVTDDLKSGYLGGYVMSVFLAGGWFLHVKWQRREITQEMERIGREKTILQEKLVGKHLPSSEE